MQLTFFVELKTKPLLDLFADGRCLQFLRQGGFAVAVGLLDLSQERAAVLRKLEQSGVPVTAWLLLPREQGYFAGIDNMQQVCLRYQQVRRWASDNDLQLSWIGLDIEPPLADVLALPHAPLKTLLRLFHRRRSRLQLERAALGYRQLVEEIQSEQRRVEAYLFPLMLDERRAQTTLLQRSCGFVDVPVDREVFMLYSTYLGYTAIGAYMSDAPSLALGCTGGGLDAGKAHFEEKLFLTWPKLERDLQLASQYSQNLYIFSLEGCVQRQMLEQILCHQMNHTAEEPRSPRSAWIGSSARRTAQLMLKAEPLFDRLGF